MYRARGSNLAYKVNKRPPVLDTAGYPNNQDKLAAKSVLAKLRSITNGERASTERARIAW